MSKAEKFISDYTRNCSNEMTFEDGSGSHNYIPWLTPEQALRAVEIAKEEMISKAFEWLKSNLQDYAGEDSCRNSVPFDKGIFEDFKQAMKDD